MLFCVQQTTKTAFARLSGARLHAVVYLNDPGGAPDALPALHAATEKSPAHADGGLEAAQRQGNAANGQIRAESKSLVTLTHCGWLEL